ncbi:unnamed protein product, partial [Polarella glacialis]
GCEDWRDTPDFLCERPYGSDGAADGSVDTDPYSMVPLVRLDKGMNLQLQYESVLEAGKILLGESD